MHYKKHLSEPWFTLVSLGLKTAEGRLCKGDFSRLAIGDTITWFNDDFNHRECTVKITKINKYSGFEQYLRKETLKKCLPGMKTMKDGLSVYYKYFTKEQEKSMGVVAIHMELI